MEHDRFEGDRTLMRVHTGESDKWHHKLLYEAIVEPSVMRGLPVSRFFAASPAMAPQLITIQRRSCGSRKSCRSLLRP